MKKKEITVNEIKAMSYTDFVGFINQWNVLPGSHSIFDFLFKFENMGHILKLK